MNEFDQDGRINRHKPWLLTILRDVGNTQIREARPARYARRDLAAGYDCGRAGVEEPSASLEAAMPRQQDRDIFRRLIAALPAPFRGSSRFVETMIYRITKSPESQGCLWE